MTSPSELRKLADVLRQKCGPNIFSQNMDEAAEFMEELTLNLILLNQYLKRLSEELDRLEPTDESD